MTLKSLLIRLTTVVAALFVLVIRLIEVGWFLWPITAPAAHLGCSGGRSGCAQIANSSESGTGRAMNRSAGSSVPTPRSRAISITRLHTDAN